MKEKLQSRKFWVCVAAFLASLGTGISGLASGHETVAICGGVCVVVSTAIYASCEACTDVTSIKTTTTSTSINVSSGDKTVVTNALNKETK